jgi:ATP-dependent Clp protease ATP-binding subunit ClpA
MFERFTRAARRVVVDARAQAEQLRHRHVGTEHLLLAMLGGEDSTAALLRDAGLTVAGVRAAVVRSAGSPSGLFGDAEAAALQSIGIDIDAVRAMIEASFGPGALESGEPVHGRRWGNRAAFSPRAKKVLELSLREALRLRHSFIGTEHILLGMLREGHGLAAQVMAQAGVDRAALRRSVEESFREAA